jgi:hypothetical protein
MRWPVAIGATAVFATLVLTAMAATDNDPTPRVRVEEGSTPWRLAEVSPDGRLISLRYGRLAGSRISSSLTGVNARESPRTVTLSVALRVQIDFGDDELMDAYGDVGVTTVRLKAPLGDRRLRHAPVSSLFRNYREFFAN